MALRPKLPLDPSKADFFNVAQAAAEFDRGYFDGLSATEDAQTAGTHTVTVRIGGTNYKLLAVAAS